MTNRIAMARARRLPPRLLAVPLLALASASVASAQANPVELRMDGVGLANNRLAPLPTFNLPGGNARYGIEYHPNLRELLVRPTTPMVCFQPGRPLGVSEPAAYFDPNGIRYTAALGVLQVGGHPYTPQRFGSVVVTGLDVMAYDVPAAEFVLGLQSTVGTFCYEITQSQTPLTPEQAICGGGLTDDPKDGWAENSLFVGAFDQDLAVAPPELELIPWRDAGAPSTNLRYGYLVRNNGGSLAQGVALREFVPSDSLRFQRSLDLESAWTCRGYGGGKCDAWPSMLYEQGYMTSNAGTIPPGGCLKFEAFRGFTLNPTGVGSTPSGILAARVISRDEPASSGGNNAARMTF
jgi:hypothetical protein